MQPKAGRYRQISPNSTTLSLSLKDMVCERPLCVPSNCCTEQRNSTLHTYIYEAAYALISAKPS